MTLTAAAAVVLAVVVGSGRAAPARARLSRPSMRGRSATLALATVPAGWMFLTHPLSAVAAAVVSVAGWAVLRRHRRERTRRACEADVVTLTFGVAAELRAGRPPGAALGAVAPYLPLLGDDVARAAAAVGNGADLAVELQAIETRWGCRRLAPVRAAWAATVASGAGVADVLDRIGESFDTDDRAAGEVAAAAAGPRATIGVLALLPVLGLALGGGLGLAPWHVLLHTRAGAGLAAGAALLDTVGLLWVRRIMAGATRP